jgi:hypothetical protein
MLDPELTDEEHFVDRLQAQLRETMKMSLEYMPDAYTRSWLVSASKCRVTDIKRSERHLSSVQAEVTLHSHLT